MYYVVNASRFETGSGYLYTECMDEGNTNQLFTAEQWNDSLDEPFEDDDSGWWEIVVDFYNDGECPAFDKPIHTSTMNKTIR